MEMSWSNLHAKGDCVYGAEVREKHYIRVVSSLLIVAQQ